MSIKSRVPWWGRVSAKIVLSRVPLGYRFWQRMNLFVHGRMDRPDYAYRVLRSHLDRLGWQTLDGRVVLELGPGDGLFTAVIARALGARQCYLVDAGPFAGEDDVAPYRACADYLRAQGLRPPAVEDCASVAEVLRACNAVYMTRGVEDLRTIPSASVEWVFSQAVLEHVRLPEFAAIVGEIRRVLSPDGVTSHQVDLKDHLGGALNNLRFPARVWESSLFVRSGFYTNRLRYSEILDVFEDAAFEWQTSDVRRWDTLPTPRRKLAAPFRSLSDEELLVQQFDVVARPARARVS